MGSSSSKIELRPASFADRDFLLRVYASTREDEMAAWGWTPEQKTVFLQMQYNIRERGYATAYPNAEISLVIAGEIPAGSLIVFRNPAEIRLVDISLLPEFRGKGIGGGLIQSLISETCRSNAPLRLSVLHTNRAARLYQRLGFIPTARDAIYCEMEFPLKPAHEFANAANDHPESNAYDRKSE